MAIENSKSALSFSGRIRSIESALNGIAIMVRTQHNAWIHAAATVVVVSTGVALGISNAEWRWLILAIVSVWTAEALNTALEFLADVASPAFHPLAGKAKDVAAGAVLISAVGAACIGAAIFGPYLKSRLEPSGN
jgi:diacylglycerol kinase (ATP)